VIPNSPAFQAWRNARREPSGGQAAPPPPASEAGVSGSGGYGLALIVSDEASSERIRRIMRDIMEREAPRKTEQ
jgi:hypothetical protein